jgi:hypothetical protein
MTSVSFPVAGRGDVLQSARPHAGAQAMSRVINLYTPKKKPVSLPKTAALTKAQTEHKAWLKAHGIKVTKNTLRT